jgi:hypothetical protein
MGTDWPLRWALARRLAVSSSIGPKLRTAEVAACERRSSARRRASSSGSSNGLIM